jgi:hypothetical protein
MNTTNLMKDSFYVPILFQIESRILVSDREARSRNTTLNDSQVRSILNRVRKAAEGATPTVPAGSEREKILAALFHDLCQLRTTLLVESGEGEKTALPTRDWSLALRGVEESIRVHSTGSGSRAYLDYLEKFMTSEK